MKIFDKVQYSYHGSRADGMIGIVVKIGSSITVYFPKWRKGEKYKGNETFVDAVAVSRYGIENLDKCIWRVNSSSLKVVGYDSEFWFEGINDDMPVLNQG